VDRGVVFGQARIHGNLFFGGRTVGAFWGFVAFVESYPVTGGAILALAVAGVIGVVKLITNHASGRRRYPYVRPTIYGSSKSFHIKSVQEYVPADVPSGYRQISYPRPDQWKRVIDVRTSWGGLRHTVHPVDENAVLVVMLRKRRKEKHILFNRPL
jgi:hypothetical protein